MISLYPLLLLYQPSIYPKKPTGISVVRNYLKIGMHPRCGRQSTLICPPRASTPQLFLQLKLDSPAFAGSVASVNHGPK